MRPALEGRYAEALDLLHGNPGPGQQRNRLGLATRADTPKALCAALHQRSAEPIAWYGVRVFTDHLGDRPAPGDDDLATIVELELAAGDRDPYRQLARLFHLLARRIPALPAPDPMR